MSSVGLATLFLGTGTIIFVGLNVLGTLRRLGFAILGTTSSLGLSDLGNLRDFLLNINREVGLIVDVGETVSSVTVGRWVGNSVGYLE